jgi:acetyl-CoA carboxylase carboxyl transferase subunit beta
VLDVTRGQDLHEPLTAAAPGREVDAWAAIERTRGERPGPDVVLDRLQQRTELRGTSRGERGAGIRMSLGRLRGRRVLMVAQTRREVTPADLRVAQRGMRLADRWRLPLVTLVDTPGGELSVAAEEGALAGEIARTLALLTSLQVPTVSCIVGQGCGGAALALLPARTRLCMENGWVSPLPPEGASVITHRTPDRAPEMARQQGVGATSLLASGVVDQVVAESPDLVSAVEMAVATAL